MEHHQPSPQIFADKKLYDEFIKEKIEKNIRINNNCWMWNGAKDKDGYGTFCYNTKKEKVHRISYKLWMGELDPTLTIDHLCNIRSCCNPTHLQQVTIKRNVLRSNGLTAINKRKTHCIHGHPFSPQNTYLYRGTHRQCKTCQHLIYLKRRNNFNSKRLISNGN